MALTAVENLLELMKKDGKPDRMLVAWEPFEFNVLDPLTAFTRGSKRRGAINMRDRWGTRIDWPEHEPGAMPVITPDDCVCPDVTKWKETVKIPDIESVAMEPGAWDAARKLQEEIRERGYLSSTIFPTGTFEQCHYLMGVEDTLVNLMDEDVEEEMHELVDAIAAWRYRYVELIVEYLKPDAICSHDDWGTSRNLFFPPDVWRSFYKEGYRKMYRLLNEAGVIVIHHADCFLEPLVPELCEIGIDIWQGVIPTNDIPKLQRELNGSMVLMGGIDSIVDRADAPEEEIRAEVRRAMAEYSKGGHWICSLTPGMKNGACFSRTDEIVNDEIVRYNKEVYGL